ncbi:hypothetical protein H0Z09_19380 [Pseudomonas sp. SWRI18]|uniref:hypothetical protein n=1 Tax=Pseudomonas sp. SWRI18 TaxID=2753888 RepID=UPI00164819D5|nr:hypothetical protein [Pseudomonas sp. SWRI18]MBC3303293.1 hypothetical protein [Pseudomonas sp. SWRI18]
MILTQGRFGGTDLLLARLNDWLILNGCEVEIAATYDEPRLKTYDVVFLPTSEVSRIWLFKARNIRFKHICVWCMGYAAFRGAYLSISDEEYSLRIESKGTLKRKLIEILKGRAQGSLAAFLDSRSVIFTDEVGAHADIGNICFDGLVSDLICPIVIDKQLATPFDYTAPSKILRLGWVGRIDMDFKFLALEQVILDVRSLRSGLLKRYEKIVFHIVGEGDAMNALRELISSDLDLEYALVPMIKKEDLSHFIRENIDLMFAMGTSSLDSAKNKVPTIVVPPKASRGESQVPQYRWVSESLGYSLGELSYAGIKPPQKTSSMQTLVEHFLESASDISTRGYEYTKAFDANLVFTKLNSIAGKSSPSHKVYARSFELYLLNKLKKLVKMVLR